MILAAPTPDAWVEEAVRNWRTLLADHANCEKKAASTALALLFAYPEDRRLTLALARLAREELRHFEQVQRLMARLQVPSLRLPPGRYAGALRALLATREPRRRIDLLLCGALIEARSCERFERLAPRLPAPLGDFYGELAASEKRHAELYVTLALESAADADPQGQEVRRRLAELAMEEARLATAPDAEFRFHSGLPRAEAA